MLEVPVSGAIQPSAAHMFSVTSEAPPIVQNLITTAQKEILTPGPGSGDRGRRGDKI